MFGLAVLLGLGFLVREGKLNVEVGYATLSVTSFVGATGTYSEVQVDRSGFSYRSGMVRCAH